MKFGNIILLALVTGILVCAGSLLCLMHRYDPTQPLLSRINLIAVAMASFLILAEIVFLTGKITFHQADKHRGRIPRLTAKTVTAVVMAILACTMAWTIGTEWSATDADLLTEKAAQSIAAVRSDATNNAKTWRERAAINQAAIGSLTQLSQRDTNNTPYKINFLAALLGLIIYGFCVPGRQKRPSKGNVMNDHIAEQAKGKLGFTPNKAYSVDGGYALYNGSKYVGFIPDENTSKRSK